MPDVIQDPWLRTPGRISRIELESVPRSESCFVRVLDRENLQIIRTRETYHVSHD